jgi:hypothetical protein
MATHRIALPRGYRTQDVLAFHSRDAEGIAEQVTESRLRKAVLLGGAPVLLDVTFADGEAICAVDADNPLGPAQQAMVADALDNILGLRIDPERFRKFVKADLGGDRPADQPDLCDRAAPHLHPAGGPPAQQWAGVLPRGGRCGAPRCRSADFAQVLALEGGDPPEAGVTGRQW